MYPISRNVLLIYILFLGMSHLYGGFKWFEPHNVKTTCPMLLLVFWPLKIAILRVLVAASSQESFRQMHAFTFIPWSCSKEKFFTHLRKDCNCECSILWKVALLVKSCSSCDLVFCLLIYTLVDIIFGCHSLIWLT